MLSLYTCLCFGFVQVVILGGTGDLALRKLYPSLNSMFRNGVELQVIGASTRDITSMELREKILNFGFLQEDSSEFLSRCEYVPLNLLGSPDDYASFAHALRARGAPEGRLFFFSLAPKLFLVGKTPHTYQRTDLQLHKDSQLRVYSKSRVGHQ